MLDRSLLMLLDEVRRKTLYLLEGVTDEQARRAPRGLQNTILCRAGHAYIVVEWLVMESVGRKPVAPSGWFDMFSWKSEPANVPPHKWPRLSEIADQLLQQHQRLRTIISDLSEEQLSQPALGRPGQPLRYYILHALQDEACHSGEIWLLRKMQRT